MYTSIFRRSPCTFRHSSAEQHSQGRRRDILVVSLAPGSCVQFVYDWTAGSKRYSTEYALYMPVRQAWICGMSCDQRLNRSYSWGKPIRRWLQNVALASSRDCNMRSCRHALTCRCIASSISALHLLYSCVPLCPFLTFRKTLSL